MGSMVDSGKVGALFDVCNNIRWVPSKVGVCQDVPGW